MFGELDAAVGSAFGFLGFADCLVGASELGEEVDAGKLIASSVGVAKSFAEVEGFFVVADRFVKLSDFKGGVAQNLQCFDSDSLGCADARGAGGVSSGFAILSEIAVGVG